MEIDLSDIVKRVLELGYTNSFTRFVYFRSDSHLSSEVCPHDINEILEFLIKRLFDYGC